MTTTHAPDDVVILAGLAIDAGRRSSTRPHSPPRSTAPTSSSSTTSARCRSTSTRHARWPRWLATTPAGCVSATTISPWQRRHLAHLKPSSRRASTARCTRRSTSAAGASCTRGYADAVTIHNYFDLDAAPGDRDRDPQAARFRRRRLRALPAGARDRAQERARRAPVRAAAPRARARLAAATLDLRAGRGRLRAGARAHHRWPAPRSCRPAVAPCVRRRVRRRGPRGVPVDLGRVRQPGGRVDRVPPLRRRIRTPCSPSSSPPGCASSRPSSPRRS